ncbi:MAG: hypothetical protein J1F12_02715 [Muribaculaceae bacterium]|nr:hypothetical protein [Muribaculaceae bacterium]
MFSVLALNAFAETMHWNAGRGYGDFRYGGEEGITIDNTSDSIQFDYFKFKEKSSRLDLIFRSSNLHGNPSQSYVYHTLNGKKGRIKNPHWGFFLTGQKDTLIFSIRSIEEESYLDSRNALEIEIYNLKESKKHRIIADEKVNPYNGDNLWKLTARLGEITLYGGDHDIHELYKVEVSDTITGFGFFGGWGSHIIFKDIEMNNESTFKKQEEKIDKKNLEEYYLLSEDVLEGYWTLFDRELEESLIKLGGNYTLACVKEGEEYLFLYISGASVNSRNWEPGDIKMRMLPTVFPGIYEVEWIDSMKDSLKHDIRAQKNENGTLLIQFPYQSSHIRLRKVP